MQPMIIDLVARDGKLSSKKVWYNVSCAASTLIMIYVTVKQIKVDYYYICLFSIFLVTVGSFEVIPKMLAMLIEWRTGRKMEQTETTNTIIVSTDPKGGE